MRCFLDTEFTRMNGLLISLALVAESGQEFYAEASDGWTPGECSEFVVRNVLPHLSGTPEVSLTRATFRYALPRWLGALGEPATVVYDLRADWRVLGALFDDAPNQFGVHVTLLRWRDSAMEERFARWMDAWFAENGPRHNALVDARGFRAGVRAVEEEFGHRLGG